MPNIENDNPHNPNSTTHYVCDQIKISPNMACCACMGCPCQDKSITRTKTTEKSIIRSLLANRKFQEIHDKWSLGNDSILEKERDKWNFGIIVRNHTRDAFDQMIEIVIEKARQEEREKIRKWIEKQYSSFDCDTPHCLDCLFIGDILEELK